MDCKICGKKIESWNSSGKNELCLYCYFNKKPEPKTGYRCVYCKESKEGSDFYQGRRGGYEMCLSCYESKAFNFARQRYVRRSDYDMGVEDNEIRKKTDQ